MVARSFPELPVNAPVSLQLRMGEEAGTYSTHVADLAEGMLVLALPIIGGGFVSIAPGAKVRLEYSDSTGTYRLHTEVVHVAHWPLGLVYVERGGHHEHQQRRQDVRIGLSVPVHFGVTHPKGVYADSDLPIFEGRTRDISGGGVQLVTQINLQIGVTLELQISLPKGPVVLPGEVVRHVAVIDQGTHKDYVLGIRFLGPARSRDRERIVAHIFEQQRLWLKRGVRID